MVYVQNLFGVGKGSSLCRFVLAYIQAFEFLVLLTLFTRGSTVLRGLGEGLDFGWDTVNLRCFGYREWGPGLVVGLLKVYTIYLLFCTRVVFEVREDVELTLRAGVNDDVLRNIRCRGCLTRAAGGTVPTCRALGGRRAATWNTDVMESHLWPLSGTNFGARRLRPVPGVTSPLGRAPRRGPVGVDVDPSTSPPYVMLA